MKKINFLKLGILLFLTTMLVDCQKEAVDTTSVDELSQSLSSRSAVQAGGEFAFDVSNCIETVALSGKFHFVIRLDKVTPGGRFSGGLHLNAEGTGIGMDTGAKYKWADNWVEQLNFNAETGIQGHQTVQAYTRLIGTGDAPSFRVLLIFTLTVNSQGELTSFKFIDAQTPC